MDTSASSATEAAVDPGPSTGSDFTFLYSSPDVGQTVEVQPEGEQEPSRAGRKRTRDPDGWTKKHVKRAGLRKNAPYIDISSLSGCCKRECIMKFSQQHLSKIRKDFESLNYMSNKISILVASYTVMRQRKLVDTKGSPIHLSHQKADDWEGHQLKRASLVLITASSTKKASL